MSSPTKHQLKVPNQANRRNSFSQLAAIAEGSRMKSMNQPKSTAQLGQTQHSFGQLGDVHSYSKTSAAFFSRGHSRNTSLNQSLIGSAITQKKEDDQLRNLFSRKLSFIKESNLSHHQSLKENYESKKQKIEKGSELDLVFPGLMEPPMSKMKPRGSSS